jgi:hypothetical protein
MTTLRIWLLIVCSSAASASQPPAAVAMPCTTEFRIPIVLHLDTAAGARPTSAFLVGNLHPGLRIVEATSGRLLWTTGAAGAYTQRFAGMTAGFSSSLAAIDTDGDGAHDRIYAGDLQGRLWRFDIDTRAPATSWVSGGIFADFSGIPGRGFRAAPDLTLMAPGGVTPWLSIALGTANTTTYAAVPGMTVLNRFYVLRDRAPYARWTQAQYDRWTPLMESDLRLADGAQLASPHDGAGYYVNLGTQQVIAPALTLDGTTVYTTTGASMLPYCNSPKYQAVTTVNVASVSAVDGSLNALDLGLHAIPAPADSAVMLVRDASSVSGRFVCVVAGQTLPDCWFDSTLQRSFWRREDAD